MLLEIIALSAADARNAEAGGADRVELVADMAVGGLSPAPATVAAVRAAAAIPVRVMLRTTPDFAADPPALRRAARDLRAAGAEAFVLGFLTPAGAVDRAALDAVLPHLDGAPWTFHRAIDAARDRAAAWRALEGLPHLDAVLTAGSPDGLTAGLPTLIAEASGGTVNILAGGGLRERHLSPLAASGVTAFHSGSAVRPGGDWSAPVDPARVRRLRARLDGSVGRIHIL
ncbi:copper homeostasis protein CutC [Dactylosporangium sp. CA-092794]|uniref:copper homeostasis protein CutC n=1 Tax=Dactylosporangium sp. CA-092794 TaxID=3239929 RepID=UPI003D912EE6